MCGKVGGGFHAPGMKLTLQTQYEGIALIQHGSTKSAIHDYHHVKASQLQGHYSSTSKEPGPFSGKHFTTHLVLYMR